MLLFQLQNPINPNKFCDPMGDMNYYLFLEERHPQNETQIQKQESVMVLATRLDTATMFDQTEFGGDSPVIQKLKKLTIKFY